MKQTANFLSLSLLIFVISSMAVGQNKKKEIVDNESLRPGQILYSNNGLLKMQFQNNSLNVIKKNTVIWQSKNWNLGINYPKTDSLVFEGGEMKCYFQNKLTFSSRTSFLNSKLILGDC